MRRTTVALAALALGALLTGRTLATSVVPLTLREAAFAADHVVHARVAEAQAAWGLHLGRKAIVTTVVLTEEVALKGAAPATLSLFGGAVGDLTMSLHGQPVLSKGDEVVLFLEGREVECPLVGVWQGAYHVRDGLVFRGDLPVVDVVKGEVIVGEDNDRPMSRDAFLGEVRGAIAAAAEGPGDPCGCGRREPAPAQGEKREEVR
jgi:hypothetical protein